MLLSHYSDATMAQAFVDEHQHQLRYVPRMGWWARDVETFGWRKVPTPWVVSLSADLAKKAVADVHEAEAVDHYRAVEARLQYNAVVNVVRIAGQAAPIRTTLDEVEPNEREMA